MTWGGDDMGDNGCADKLRNSSFNCDLAEWSRTARSGWHDEI